MRALPPRWWLVPVLAFIVAQLLATTFLALAKDRQEAIPYGDGYQYFVPGAPADPPWDRYVSGWNGNGYREIALNGYPSEVPVAEDGSSVPTPWAFYPLFPLVVKAVMLTGLSFGYAAILVSLSCGLAAVTLTYRLVLQHSGSRWVAAGAIGTILLWPSAPLFQLAYAEAMAMALLAALLTAIAKHKYLTAIPLVLLLGLTRPVGPPDLVLVGLHGLMLAWPALRARSVNRATVFSRPVWSYGALLLASTLATLTWPVLSLIATGENAFFLARAAYSSESFFFAWARNGWTVSEAYPLTAFFVMAFFLLWAALQLFNRALPPIMRVWPLVLSLYIFVVTAPVGTEYRYLSLGFFVFPFMGPARTRALKALQVTLVLIAVLAGLYFQHRWVNHHWVSEPGVLRKNV